MKNSSILLAVVIALFLSPLQFSLAAGPEQLEEGMATLRGESNDGDIGKALTLLKSAAEAMPDSVDAQLTLADCFMKLGQIEDAVGQYRKVLKISPNHRQAKQIVEALTGKTVSIEQQIAVARELIDTGAVNQARSILGHLRSHPMDPSQRETVKLMQAEATLWASYSNDSSRVGNSILEALTLAVQLSKESKNPDIVGPARVIAALSLSATQKDAATKLISDAGEVGNPWAKRAELVTLLDRLKDPAQAANVSNRLAGVLATIPECTYRSRLLLEVMRETFAAVDRKLAARDIKGALAVAWPMIGSGPVPAEDVVLKPVKLLGGWLPSKESRDSSSIQSAVSLLTRIGNAESLQERSKASLLGYWLAAEAARQAPEAHADQLLVVAQALAAQSRPAPNRKEGDVLSRADEVQRQVLISVVDYVTADGAKKAAVLDKAADLILGQIARYKSAGEIETGLKQFVEIRVVEGEAPSAHLAGALDRISLCPAHSKLLMQLAGAYATHGHQQFDKAEAMLDSKANRSLNQPYTIALMLSSQQSRLYAENAETVKAIADRYLGKQSWQAAQQVWTLYYAGREGNYLAWALVSLKAQQAEYDDGQRLTAQRKLGEMLSPLVKEAITDIIAAYKTAPSKSSRQHVSHALDSLINRYANLTRWDLSESVIATASEADNAKTLADWSLWSRAQLLARQAVIALKSNAQPADADAQPVALNELHKAEIALIQQLIKEHAQSDYRGTAVNRISQIAGIYQGYRSFDVARTVLTDFLKAQPDLSSARELELKAVRIDLAKARDAFERRDDKKTPPNELSPEYAAAIDSIAAYLKKHPSGHRAKAAEDELFAVARTYGQVGSWPLVRGVLDRFAASIPDYRSPMFLRYLRAVTYLGELDRGYAMALLTPQPQGAGRPGRSGGDASGLAMGYGGAGSGIAANGPGYDHGQYGAAPGGSTRALPSQGESPSGGFANLPQGAPPVIANGTFPATQPNAAQPQLTDPSSATYTARAQPSETALAMIRQSQQRQYQQIAMLERQVDIQNNEDLQVSTMQQGNFSQSIALPTGALLSEEEMARQSAAADQAYKILIKIVQEASADEASIAQQARGQVLWLFGFFEGQQRFDRAIVLIQQYLKDRPNDPAKVALSYQAINDQLSQASRRQSTERITLAWLDERHKLFDEARNAIAKFIADYKDKKDWIHRAHLLVASSFDIEAGLAAHVSAIRSGGLLVRSAEVLFALPELEPEHAEVANVPRRIWDLAVRLQGLHQQDQSIYLLSQIPIQFPVDALAPQAVLRIAELHAAGLADPLKAVETYQEYLNLNGDNQNIRSQIFSIGQQLAAKRRFLEALHVFGVFVDSFPTDQRAPEALRAIGKTHQSNEAWQEAITSYERIVDEYPNVAIIPDVKLASAECQINLSQWRDARRLYEEFQQQHAKHGGAAIAQSRLGVLKNLERYQKLISDAEVSRNKDDAQFQIGRIVLEQLNNHVKAVSEFRKVVTDFPKSDLADDAQLEIGKALLALQRLDEAREAFLEVPRKYPNSPVADDALYLVGQSYEQHAVRLASVTVEKARQEAFVRGQKQAYRFYNENLVVQDRERSGRRAQLKGEGKSKELALDEASEAFRIAGGNYAAISNTSRQADVQAETESALKVANRQDRINEAYRQAVTQYVRAASDYPLGDQTDDSLLRVAQILEVNLKDRAAAMQTYQKIVGLFPGTPVAQDAAWKVAQFYEQEGKFAASATAYRDFIRNYPASPRVADAQFALAEVFEQLGRWVDAMDAYETFRQKFAQHPRARVAVEQINWIKAYRK